MFKKYKCECHKLEEQLKKHEKQHTIEHYIVLAFLGILIALEIAPYVL